MATKERFDRAGGDQTLYRIGEAAALGGISQRTLRLYDELKLITPDTVSDTGYRYYSLETLLKIPVINYLKKMGFSLEEVAKIFRSRDFALIKQRFNESLEDCEEEQRELNERRELIVTWSQLIDEANYVMSVRPTSVGVKYLPSEPFLAMPYRFWGNYADATINLEFTQFVEEHGNVIAGPVIIRHASIGGYLEGRCALDPEGCGVLVIQRALRPIDASCRFDSEAGMYLSTYHVGSAEDMGEAYDRILSSAEEQGLEPLGCSYERFVTDYWTTYDTDRHVTEILVPVRKA